MTARANKDLLLASCKIRWPQEVFICVRLNHSRNDRSDRNCSTLRRTNQLFVDAVGASWRGRQMLQQAWSGYFAWMPNCTITITAILERDGKVSEWHVYCDTKTVYDIMNRNM